MIKLSPPKACGYTIFYLKSIIYEYIVSGVQFKITFLKKTCFSVRQVYLHRVEIPPTFIKYHQPGFWSGSVFGKKSPHCHTVCMWTWGVFMEESEAAQSTGHAHSFLGPATGDVFGTLRSGEAALRASQPAASLIAALPPHLHRKCPSGAGEALLEVGWAGVCPATAVSRVVVYLLGIYVDHNETSHEHPQPRVGLCPAAC